jgi:hypothetical protein
VRRWRSPNLRRRPAPTQAAPPAAAATAPASLSDLPAYPEQFVRRRLLTFVGIVLGYSCFYLTRNSLTYTAPAMVADPTLGISMTDVSGSVQRERPMRGFRC